MRPSSKRKREAGYIVSERTAESDGLSIPAVLATMVHAMHPRMQWILYPLLSAARRPLDLSANDRDPTLGPDPGNLDLRHRLFGWSINTRYITIDRER